MPIEWPNFPLQRTPAYLRWEGCLTNCRRIGRSLLRTLAGFFRCLSGGIARRAGRCWRRLLCAPTSGRTCVVLSSLCVRITAHFGGCRNFAIATICMLARWYMLLGQFSVTFEYRPGAQLVNADGLSRQKGHIKGLPLQVRKQLQRRRLVPPTVRLCEGVKDL